MRNPWPRSPGMLLLSACLSGWSGIILLFVFAEQVNLTNARLEKDRAEYSTCLAAASGNPYAKALIVRETAKALSAFDLISACDSVPSAVKPERERSAQIRLTLDRRALYGWWVGVALCLFMTAFGVVSFALYLKRETAITSWHVGKLAIVWGVFVLICAMMRSAIEPVGIVFLTIPLSLPILAVTWKWLSAREGNHPSAREP